jgi:hypothetical protein
MQSYHQILTDAVDVWNAAIQRHGRAFPYREIVPRCEDALRGTDIGVEIYETDRDRPSGRYTLRFEDGRIRTADHNPDAPVMWVVSGTFLRDVVENRVDYLEHPVKLDWDWLTHPAGISA